MIICRNPTPHGVCGFENRDSAKFCACCGALLGVRQPGETVDGRYCIVRAIGRGAFGAVYEAADQQGAGLRVALKETFDPAHIAQYRAEFAVLSHLKHDHLPHYHRVFMVDGNGYLIMEYVPGQSLEDVLNKQGGPLLETQVLGYALQLCDALGFLHSQTPPIIHRDIKPANVRLTPEGLIKLVDFGLVKEMTTGGGPGGSAAFGTRGYAPPEQYGLNGQHTEPRSDIYALGATLYHLLTGQEPPEAMQRIAAGTSPHLIPKVLNPALSDQVNTAIIRAMAITIDLRFPDAAAMRSALVGGAQVKPKPAPLAKPAPPKPAPPKPAPIPAPPRPAPMPRPLPPPSPPPTQQPAPMPPAPLLKPAPLPAPPKPVHDFGISCSTIIAIALGIGLLIGVFTALDGLSAPSWPSPAPTVQVVPTAPPTLVPATPTRVASTTATRPPATSTPATRAVDSGTWTEPVTGMEFVRVPAGEFTMGSVSGYDDEKPPHRVTVGDYWIGLTEVTNAQFRPFVEGGGYADESLWTEAGWRWRTNSRLTQPSHWDDAEWNRPDQPLVGVSWHEAVAYTRWLTREAGREFRLPTEAEWEKACRGTDGRTYPWGNEPPDADRANFDDNVGRTTAVGSYPAGASPYGALDMAGNVCEWTDSLTRSYPYDAADGREDPEVAGTRSLRGGSFDYFVDGVRCADRYRGYPDRRYYRSGFRVMSPGF